MYDGNLSKNKTHFYHFPSKILKKLHFQYKQFCCSFIGETNSFIIYIDDTRKNYNSTLVHDGSSWSMTSAHGSQDEETRPEPSRKDEFQTSSSLAKPRPEPTRRWIVQTRHWTSHLSVIDKVDGNRCQRRLDELGQTIRC